MEKRYSKWHSSVIIASIYLLAFMAAYFFFPLFTFAHALLNILMADILATLVVFIFSVILKNSSVYDPYWSVVPPVIVFCLIKLFPQGDTLRQMVIAALVLLWGIRLTMNWLRGWQGLSFQDWRYTSIAAKTGKWYWPVSFLGIHLMPTVFVFLGCLPLWYALSSPAPFSIFDAIATLFTLSAIVLEMVADEQLRRFRKNSAQGTFIKSGLWNYSRHPNYLGEICFWGGLFIFVLSSTGFSSFTGWWTVVGLLAMIILFTWISIPLMESRIKQGKPGYAGYMDQVPALLPRLYSGNRKTRLPGNSHNQIDENGENDITNHIIPHKRDVTEKE